MANASWNVEWVWLATGWLLGAVGLVVLVWALFWDRARGRRRCPGCWYDLSGAVVETSRDREGSASHDGVLCVCPECGRKVGRERELGRTRRRWGWMVAAMLVMGFGYQTAWRGTPGREGVYAYVPTVVMLAVAPGFHEREDQRSRLEEALIERLQSDNVTPWDQSLAALVELRCARIEWPESIVHRSRWPVSIPLRVRLSVPDGARSCFEGRTFTLKWLDGEVADATLDLLDPNVHYFVVSSPPPDYIDLPAPKLGVNHYTMRVSIRSSFGWSRSETTPITVEGVATIDESVIPVSDPVVDQEIRDQLVWSTFAYGGKAGIWVGARERWTPVRRDMCYAFTGELLRDGKVIAADDTADLWWNSMDFSVLQDISQEEAEQQSLDLDSLSVRLSACPRLALPHLWRTHYWNGTITVPLRSLPWAHGVINVRYLDASELPRVPFGVEAQQGVAEQLRPAKR